MQIAFACKSLKKPFPTVCARGLLLFKGVGLLVSFSFRFSPRALLCAKRCRRQQDETGLLRFAVPFLILPSGGFAAALASYSLIFSRLALFPLPAPPHNFLVDSCNYNNIFYIYNITY